MIIDLHLIATWVVTLSSILGGVYGLYKAAIRPILKKLEEHESDLNDLKAWTKNQQEDIECGAAERRIMIEGVLACLKGLQEQGCNGPVSRSIAEIEEYLIRKLDRTFSKKEVI